jgi:hypothetical protein
VVYPVGAAAVGVGDGVGRRADVDTVEPVPAAFAELV